MINKFKIKNLRLKIQIFRKGFTLVEVLIYAGIVTMIITFALLGTYQIIDYQDRLEDQLEVTENSKFLIQKIAWVLQNNSAINSPVLGSSGLSLSVNKLNYGSNPLVITLSNGRVWLSAAGASAVSLTNSRVTASNLIVDHLNFSNQSAIRFRVTLENSIASSTVDTTVFIK